MGADRNCLQVCLAFDFDPEPKSKATQIAIHISDKFNCKSESYLQQEDELQLAYTEVVIPMLRSGACRQSGFATQLAKRSCAHSYGGGSVPLHVDIRVAYVAHVMYMYVT